MTLMSGRDGAGFSASRASGGMATVLTAKFCPAAAQAMWPTCRGSPENVSRRDGRGSAFCRNDSDAGDMEARGMLIDLPWRPLVPVVLSGIHRRSDDGRLER